MAKQQGFLSVSPERLAGPLSSAGTHCPRLPHTPPHPGPSIWMTSRSRLASAPGRRTTHGPGSHPGKPWWRLGPGEWHSRGTSSKEPASGKLLLVLCSGTLPRRQPWSRATAIAGFFPPFFSIPPSPGLSFFGSSAGPAWCLLLLGLADPKRCQELNSVCCMQGKRPTLRSGCSGPLASLGLPVSLQPTLQEYGQTAASRYAHYPRGPPTAGQSPEPLPGERRAEEEAQAEK